MDDSPRSFSRAREESAAPSARRKASSDTEAFVFEYWKTTAVTPGEKREWRWRLRTRAGEVIAHNEGFSRLVDCMRSVRLLRKVVANAKLRNLTPSDS